MIAKRNSIGMTICCLVAGLALLGCDKAKDSTETASVTGTTLTSSSAGSCCSAKPAGGCPDCAAATSAVAMTDACSECPACAGGSETANCKCEDETTFVSAKLAESKSCAKGCCGKCAGEQVAKKTEGCDNCPACAGGSETAKCKCEESTLVRAELAAKTKNDDCSDCPACAAGSETAKCKCEESKKTPETSEESK